MDLRRFFFGQMALALLVAISGPKKSQCLGPTPSNTPRNGSCLPRNHYVLRHINNRYVNSYNDGLTVIFLLGCFLHD
jgi:hypothetical protein